MAVPIQSPPPPSDTEEALLRMEAERKLLADERFTGWGVVWTLFGFKIATVALIVILGSQNTETGSEKWWAYLISTTWYWFVIPLFALSGFIIWRMRLYKVRKQLQDLKRSEFTTFTASEFAALTEEEKAQLLQVRRLDEADR